MPNFAGYLPNKTEPEAGDAGLEQKLKQKLGPKLRTNGGTEDSNKRPTSQTKTLIPRQIIQSKSFKMSKSGLSTYIKLKKYKL